MGDNCKDFKFCKSDIVEDGGYFFILPHYNKSFGIKSYSVWYQDASHIQQGGLRFALKIKNCKSFEEGVSIAEKFYADTRAGLKPKFIGTQYVSGDTYITINFSN